MRRGMPTLEQGPQRERARVNERLYSDRDQKLESAEHAQAFAADGFLRGEHTDDVSREAARRLLDLRFARIQLVANAFGGHTERLDVYPQNLAHNGDIFVSPDAHTVMRFRDEKPFARLDVARRTYVFFLPQPGCVDAYDAGVYKGGNLDLRYYEVFGQIRGNDWFGCERKQGGNEPGDQALAA